MSTSHWESSQKFSLLKSLIPSAECQEPFMTQRDAKARKSQSSALVNLICWCVCSWMQIACYSHIVRLERFIYPHTKPNRINNATNKREKQFRKKIYRKLFSFLNLFLWLVHLKLMCGCVWMSEDLRQLCNRKRGMHYSAMFLMLITLYFLILTLPAYIKVFHCIMLGSQCCVPN